MSEAGGVTGSRKTAAMELRRISGWIAVAATAMVGLALGYLYLMGEWSLHAVIATIVGVFLSVILGCGLFALAFFSDKSGHDASAGRSMGRQDATERAPDDQ